MLGCDASGLPASTSPRCGGSSNCRTVSPADAQAEAERAAERGPGAGGVGAGERADRTDLAFVTVDPPGSLDLDQAVRLERRPGGGYRVLYAIADVAAFVRPGGRWRRRPPARASPSTCRRQVPLHPPVLSEDVASCCPTWSGGRAVDDRPGRRRRHHRGRGEAGARAQPGPAGLRGGAGRRGRPAGRGADRAAAEIGKLLLARAAERGAINLPLPEQEIEPDGDGWRLRLRAPVPVEEYNAQISLLTGRARPASCWPAGSGCCARCRHRGRRRWRSCGHGAALGITWPDGASAGSVIGAVDPAQPGGAAFLDQAAELLRGAGYTAFDGEVPARSGARRGGLPVRARDGAAAPPRRPVRHRGVSGAARRCRAAAVGPAGAARAGRGDDRADRRASTAERAAVDLTEAVLLADRVGQEFPAVVVDTDRNGGAIALEEPPVRARCEGEGLPLGERITVRLTEADPVRRRVTFRRA
jgi:hypothetical protein